MSAKVRLTLLYWLLPLLLLMGCGGQKSVLTNAVESPASLAGWTPVDETQVFDAETLYDLVDGQADAFFAYGFEQVAVQSYESAEGILRLEVWQLASSADAYGLFTTYRSGEPVSLGQDGDGDPGRRLDFWQDRYFVRLFAAQPIADEWLQAVGAAVSGSLPAGGERPALMERLHQEGLVERSGLFFHQEISVQSYVWLGGQNLLGLSAETDGVLARYETESGVAYLLLVQYPEQGAAQAGLEALQSPLVTDLIAAQVQENLLGAVFGAASELDANFLLDGALDVTSVPDVQDNAVIETVPQETVLQPQEIVPQETVSQPQETVPEATSDMNTESGGEHPVPQELAIIPQEYLQPADQQGTLVEITYNTYESKTYAQQSKALTKRAIVYLPYGYSEENKYNVFYLMHGGWGDETRTLGTPDNPNSFKNVIDHAIVNGEIEPLIIVCPTYNNESPEDSGDYTLAFYTLTVNYHNELVNDLIPAVEGAYATYAESTAPEDIKNSRDHRAFGGFSMGSVATWYTFVHCLDEFRYFLPMSGAMDYEGNDVDAAVTTSGHRPDDFFIYAFTGTDDFEVGHFTSQIEGMLGMPSGNFIAADSEAAGNIAFRIKDGYAHDGRAAMEYTYNGLMWFWN